MRVGAAVWLCVWALIACGSSETVTAVKGGDDSPPPGEEDAGRGGDAGAGEGGEEPDLARYDDGFDQDDGAPWDHTTNSTATPLFDFSVHQWQVFGGRVVVAADDSQFAVYEHEAAREVARTTDLPRAPARFEGTSELVVAAIAGEGESRVWSRASGRIQKLERCGVVAHAAVVVDAASEWALINASDSSGAGGGSSPRCRVNLRTLETEAIPMPASLVAHRDSYQAACQAGVEHDFVSFGYFDGRALVATIDGTTLTERVTLDGGRMNEDGHRASLLAAGEYFFARNSRGIWRVPKSLAAAPERIFGVGAVYAMRGGKVVLHESENGALEIMEPDGRDRVRLADQAYLPDFMAKADTTRLRMVPYCTPEEPAGSRPFWASNLRVYDLRGDRVISVDDRCGLEAIVYSNRYAIFLRGFEGQLDPVGIGVAEARDILDLDTGRVRSDTNHTSSSWLAGVALQKSAALLHDGVAWHEYLDAHSGEDVEGRRESIDAEALYMSNGIVGGALGDGFVLGSRQPRGDGALIPTLYVPARR